MVGNGWQNHALRHLHPVLAEFDRSLAVAQIQKEIAELVGGGRLLHVTNEFWGVWMTRFEMLVGPFIGGNGEILEHGKYIQ